MTGRRELGTADIAHGMGSIGRALGGGSAHCTKSTATASSPGEGCT